jgi:OPA family glycerol-3-phosphate transporter-like MFS transporter
MSLVAWFRTGPAAPRLPDAEVKKVYRRYRWQVFEAGFIGYTFYYFVRNNLAVVAPDIGEALQYSKPMIGNIFAITAICYGIGKFVMGYMSDHSNPRKFMATGLFLTACVNFMFAGSTTYAVHLVLWALNGLVQGMGGPSHGRILAHYYSYNERGFIYGAANIAHNLGGGIIGVFAAWCATRYGWEYAFIFPGLIALAGSGYLYFRLRNIPVAEGLPPIQEYRNAYPPNEKVQIERDLSFREMFMIYILPNKFIWILCASNFFVYIARYCMLDWGPYYLVQQKGATIIQAGMSTLILEFSGIAGVVLTGWLSDRMDGRRGKMCTLCMAPLVLVFIGIMLTPAGMLWLDYILFGCLGFLIYSPLALIITMSLDVTSRRSVGTAQGFVGLFGYIGRVVQGMGIGLIAEYRDWHTVFYLIIGSTVIGSILMLFTWKVRPQA